MLPEQLDDVLAKRERVEATYPWALFSKGDPTPVALFSEMPRANTSGAFLFGREYSLDARSDDALMRRSPPKSTIEDLPRSVLPVPNEVKSPAPAVVVLCWCGLVERMDRSALDRFTRRIWKRFDHRDLEPLKWAIIRRRRILAMRTTPTAQLGVVPSTVSA